MIGPKIIGPKCSIVCVCISAWGIIMFLLLGAFFHVESPALREDISPKDDSREAVSEAYSNTAINCYITGAIYAGTLVFAGWQVAVNNSRTYQMA